MDYAEKQEQLSIAAKELIDSLKKFRDASDAIMMDIFNFDAGYRYKLKDLRDHAFNIQIKLTEL